MEKYRLTSKDRMEHVRNAIDRIMFYTKHHTEESFSSDHQCIDACLYQYTIISEGIFMLDYDILEKYPYPWHRVKAFRNYILHQYHSIDFRILWDTTVTILPELKTLLETIQKNEFPGNA